MVVITTLPPPEEGVRVKQESVGAVVGGRNKGMGTLIISESRVSWTGDKPSESFSLEYPHIAVHALSRDLNSFPKPCLYLLLDTKVDDEEEEESDSDDDDCGGPVTDVRFVPDDADALEKMYDAMKECQALHPDPEAQEDSEEEEGQDEEQEDEEDGYFDANNDVNGENEVEMDDNYADAEADH